MVFRELQRSQTPPYVRQQIEAPPPWLKIVSPERTDDPALQALHEGERAALALGLQLRADLILIDERRGTAVARQMGLEITGTLGILVSAAEQNLVTLTDAFTRLRQTSFRCSEELMKGLLSDHNRLG